MKAKNASDRIDLESKAMREITNDLHNFLDNQEEWNKYAKELGTNFICSILLLTMFDRTQRCIRSDNFDELFSFVLSSLLAFTEEGKKAKNIFNKGNRVVH